MNKDKQLEEIAKGEEPIKKKESRYQFTFKEIEEMIKEEDLFRIATTLAEQPENNGKSGKYLIDMAKGIKKQLKLM